MNGDGLEHLVVELAAQVRGRFYGKYRGLVADVDDPERLGRIKARVPEVLGDTQTPWAMPCTPYPGAGEGWFVIPSVDAGVWIEFEAGDPSRPIWTGGWFGSGDVPKDEEGSDASPTRKVLRTTSGLLLALDDDGRTIALSDSDGDNLLKISVNDGQVRVQAASKVIVEAPAIELVDGASHPLAFGDDLLQYLNTIVTVFNAHMHPGQTVMGMPVTPMTPVTTFQPPSQSMLSTKVKTG